MAGLKGISIFIVMTLLVSGCSILHGNDSIYSAQYPEQKKTVDQGYDYLDRKDYTSAETVFLNFLKKYPSSALHARVQFGLGASYEGQSRWEDGLSIYQDIIKAYYSEEATAAALYRSSICYEGMGQIEKSLMALLDLKKRKQFLPEDIALASIPARVSALYYRLDNEEEGAEYLKQAEAGLNSLKARRGANVSEPWLAEIYNKMGFIAMGEINESNFLQMAESVQRLQKYLLYSIEIGDPIWSKLSLENLQFAYRDLWNFLQTAFKTAPPDKLEQEAQKKRRVAFIGKILSNMDELQAQRHPEKLKSNPYYDDLFYYLSQVEKVAENELRDLGGLGLTDEARDLQSPKLRGKIRDREGARAAADYLRENDRYRKKSIKGKSRKSKRRKKDPNI